MSMKLYKFDLSPPARATMMMIDLLEIPTEMIDVNILEKEHLNPEYLQVNSQHTVPVLIDDDFKLTDSHAIMMYLSDAYASDDDLYPRESKKRAMVNQRLFFHASILYPRLQSVMNSIRTEGEKIITEKQIKDINEAYSFLEEFLCKTKYIAGNYLTIADLSTFATISSLIHIAPICSERYLRICTWLIDIERKPFAVEYNAPGAASLGKLLQKNIDVLRKQ